MDATQREIRQGQRMAAAAQPLQPAENHPGPGRGHTKKPHEKAKAGNRSAYLVQPGRNNDPLDIEWFLPVGPFKGFGHRGIEVLDKGQHTGL
jgi:hypothetical protein